ncbi:MAG TPA: hypothetical protein VE987_08475 [Polyangiaceae bacterium]|nr:hypothetical protein [Polyangiaceae bacterium]
MSTWFDAGDLESLQLTLRLAAGPSGAFEVRIEFSEIDVAVEVIDVDLRRALRAAAEECAEKLRDNGYVVTSGDVIGALEGALESSEWGEAPAHSQSLN